MTSKSDKNSSLIKRVAKRFTRIVERNKPGYSPRNRISVSNPGGFEDKLLHIVTQAQRQGLTPRDFDIPDGEAAADAIAITVLIHKIETAVITRLLLHAELSLEWRRLIRSAVLLEHRERYRERKETQKQREKEREAQQEKFAHVRLRLRNRQVASK